MLRPPKKEGQAAWFERAMDLRNQAKLLAETVATKDLERSRAGLVTLAGACNRCHQTFRISVQITPFEDTNPLPKVE
jgi:hypothetical protein